MAAHRAGALAEAERGYLALLRHEPDSVVLLNNLAHVLLDTGRASEALTVFDRAVQHGPEHANAHCGRGSTLQRLGRLDDAVASFERTLELDGAHLGALNNLATVYVVQGKQQHALELYRRALDVDPKNADALQNLGVLLAGAGQLTAAIDCYHNALAINPTHGPTHCNLANAFCRQGRASDALRHLGKAISAQPTNAAWHSNLLLTLHYVDGVSPDKLFSEHQRWAQLRAGEVALMQERLVASRPHPLRIGYLSPDFRAHAVAFFIEPILRAHDTEAFELFAYANVPAPDATTRRLRQYFSTWRDVAGTNDDELAQLIRSDRIDVLVDLAGHTDGNRLLAMARRPAPVQMTYLGYPNTTGMPMVDYRLTDRWADPPGAERFHSEQLAIIDAGMHCYAAPAGAPAVAPPPCQRNGWLTFGSFNNTSKITAHTISRWAKVLLAVPDARMLLKFRTLSDPATADHYRGLFERFGVSASRLDMRGGQYDHASHLAVHAEVDMVLDTFPYNGTTTSCEALWMGVAVLTRSGDNHVARVGCSILSQLGLERFVVRDDEALVRKASALATELGVAELVALRKQLRGQMAQSTLCDATLKTKQIEQHYRAACGRS